MICSSCRYEVHEPPAMPLGYVAKCVECIRELKSAKNVTIVYRKTA